MNAGPLADVRVVDLSTVLAGPNCARYLADFGADVIKVERPEGDSLRRMAWRDPRDGEGLWWKLVNRNKRTIALDLKDPDDHAVLVRLLADAHVRARGVLVPIDGTPMQTVIARLSATPGRAVHVGRPLDADGDAIRRDGWRRDPT